MLLEALDGTLAATAIICFDAISRAVTLEPRGMHRTRGAEAQTMLGARELYCGVGVESIRRDGPHVRRARQPLLEGRARKLHHATRHQRPSR